jgi:hypothetical protein
MAKLVCSTDTLYHYLFNPDPDAISAILENGLHPLSDFPDSPRWKQIESVYPGFFEWLYEEFAEPVLKKPYTNSGIFLSPIDFRRMPDSFMHTKPRINVPLEHIDPQWAVLSYVIEEQRHSYALSPETLIMTAELWDEEMVAHWFGVDSNRLFFYVPQVVTYQPEGIRIVKGDFDDPAQP